MWLRNFLTELKILFTDPVPVYVDNKSAIALSRDPVNHQASKHIDLRFKFILSAVKDNLVSPIYIPTGDNISDIFTKSTDTATFVKHVSKLVQ